MEIIQKDNAEHGLFQAVENGEVAGEMSFTRSGNDRIIINHTEVNGAFGGKGIGKMLVLHAVMYARQHHIRIVPLCTYAKKVLDSMDGLGDVL